MPHQNRQMLNQAADTSTDTSRSCARCGKTLVRKRYFHSGIQLWVDEALQVFSARKFCNRACHRPGHAQPKASIARGAPFEDRYIPEPNSGCWLWLYGTNSQGYAAFTSAHGRLASRYVYATFIGPLTADQMVLHKCDTPSCVNPDHLFVGTQTDNMRDCSQKGRMHFGEADGMAKLTAEQVHEIRLQVCNGVVYRELAKRFNVSRSQISRIVQRKHWPRT
jgi:hypothetical protein